MLTSTPLLRKISPSSARWLSRQNTDPYVRLRTASNPPNLKYDLPSAYRSRSAFKLISIFGKYPQLLGPGKAVVDLGAAPGGWSQVAMNLSGKRARAKRQKQGQGPNLDTDPDPYIPDSDTLSKDNSRIIALDILPIMPIDGVHTIQGDFLSPEVRDQVRQLVGGGGVNTVLSDMMGSMTGVRDRDVQISLDLCMAAWEFGRGVLKSALEVEMKANEGESNVAEDEEETALVKGRRVYPGGNMVLKFFAHPDLTEFKRKELQPHFAKVSVEKPKESRSESSEAYFVCLGFKGVPSPPMP